MTPEHEKQLNYIEFICRKPVDEMLAGEYHSVFKGRGLEFDEVREYQRGDDVRLIDWNVAARTGKPHIKRFIEERELCLFLVVDYSASESFSSVEKTKVEVAAELCALLAFSAIKNNDKVGLIIFTDSVEEYIPPAKGKSHVMRIVDKLLTHKPKSKGTNISSALDFLGGIASRHCVAFVMSDFQDTGYEEQLAILSHQHDLTAVSLTDRRESTLPDAGFVHLTDSETGKTTVVDTSSRSVRDKYEQATRDRIAERNELLRQSKVDHIKISTDQDYVQELISFFRSRERRVADETGG